MARRKSKKEGIVEVQVTLCHCGKLGIPGSRRLLWVKGAIGGAVTCLERSPQAAIWVFLAPHI